MLKMITNQSILAIQVEKGDILAKLRKEAKKAEKIYLATDPDREGEAISWHLSKALKLEDDQIKRITLMRLQKCSKGILKGAARN